MGKRKAHKDPSFVDKYIRGEGRRKLKKDEKTFYEVKPRDLNCLAYPSSYINNVEKLSDTQLRLVLAEEKTMEHQILALREFVKLREEEIDRRLKFTQLFLDCLLRHHNIIYEGTLFGSSANGLGFRDSDVDLRLRCLRLIKDRCGKYTLENDPHDQDITEKILRNIAFQTRRCCPAVGSYVPSSRCPIAKLYFLQKNGKLLKDGLNFDISLSFTHFATFNSEFLRFLCILEPKFQLLSMVLRYWSKRHNLIVSGRFSSYALVNMLIFFCQTLEPPLLPTVDEMRDIFLKHDFNPTQTSSTKVEWQCLLSLEPDRYRHGPKNKELLSVLLLKFFEFYLNFPYSTHVITIRPGKALNHQEFASSTLFHHKFPIKDYLNIQDPFDLKHNLTQGMVAEHFELLITTMRFSYERLFSHLMMNFKQPFSRLIQDGKFASLCKQHPHLVDWGLNALFMKLTSEEIMHAKGF